MLIYLGADHRGFSLKELIKADVKGQGYDVADMGAETYNEGDDYPLFAKLVGEKIRSDPENSRGILICGSGVGMDIVVNKFKGVRAGFALVPDQVYAARHDDNINALILAVDFIEEPEAKKMVNVFLATPFGGDERYRRRLQEIAEIEEGEKEQK